ncbi:MAG: D-aminoacyl-tRNA deacylase [Nanoarchaeota archaeon]
MPSLAIISSTQDRASMNIRKQLFNLHPFEKAANAFEGHPILKTDIGPYQAGLYTIKRKNIFAENLDELNKDLIIFLSKHAAKSGIPSLSAHTTGNWGTAEFGGKDSALSTSPANLLKAFINNLMKNEQEFDVIQEVTHHGPYCKTPSLFIELGSTENEWSQPRPAKALAETLIQTLINPIKEHPSAIAFGGPHNMPNFKKTIRGDEYAIGHTCAKYQLPDINDQMIQQAIEATLPTPEIALLDWKGLGQEKQRLLDALEAANLDYKRLK